MWLADAWIHGLRRFGDDGPHRVRIDAKLVCLIGANEAGKSTVLDAMEIAHSDNPVGPADRTRREQVGDDREIVRLRYRLDDADRDAIAGIRCEGDPRAIHWFDVVRQANGTATFTPDPTLRRDRAPRRSMADQLRVATDAWWPELPDDDDANEEPDARQVLPTFDQEHVERLTEALSNDEPATLDGALMTELRELANEVDATNPDLANALRHLADHEGAQHPTHEARDILWQRVPHFVRFDDEARRLESEYDLNQVAANPGPALSNLAALANLNLNELLAALGRGETGTVVDIRDAANRVLAERFAAWQQQPQMKVVLDNEGAILRIHVQSGTGPTMPFRERSDGLRQFVALVALTAQNQREVPPILLIDEVETHLHYDAQADLLEVLAEQNAVSQVIYTTHSAASLPEDLGLGVRVVEGIEDRTASSVRQNFWRDDHPGMGALLMAMGAASLAFVPLRPAVIAEGGTELVLLPSLMREAADRDHLGFAVVPGSSSTPPERIAGLDLHGVRTVWVLDADDGGRTRRNQLIAAGIPAERVLMLSDDGDLEIEDLIAPAAYCEAVRRYVSDVGGTPDTFTPDDLATGPCQRHDAALAWCEARGVPAPGKIAIANKIVELVGEVQLVDAAQIERLSSLCATLVELLAATPVTEP